MPLPRRNRGAAPPSTTGPSTVMEKVSRGCAPFSGQCHPRLNIIMRVVSHLVSSWIVFVRFDIAEPALHARLAGAVRQPHDATPRLS